MLLVATRGVVGTGTVLEEMTALGVEVPDEDATPFVLVPVPTAVSGDDDEPSTLVVATIVVGRGSDVDAGVSVAVASEAAGVLLDADDDNVVVETIGVVVLSPTYMSPDAMCSKNAKTLWVILENETAPSGGADAPDVVVAVGVEDGSALIGAVPAVVSTPVDCIDAGVCGVVVSVVCGVLSEDDPVDTCDCVVVADPLNEGDEVEVEVVLDACVTSVGGGVGYAEFEELKSW